MAHFPTRGDRWRTLFGRRDYVEHPVSVFKDCEFSRATVDELWQAGQGYTRKVLTHPDACRITDIGNGVRVFDLYLLVSNLQEEPSMNKDEVNKRAFAMPLISPAFPPGP